jgi:predicted DNA-binding transcriptional regulator AlpA
MGPTEEDLSGLESNVGNGKSDEHAESGREIHPDACAGFCTTRLAELPAAALLDERALAGCLGVTTRTVRRIIARGQFPAGVKLGGRRMWLAGKVVGFLTDAADLQVTNARKLALRLGQGGI